MNLLPSLATCPSNVAGLFTKPLSRHRFPTAALIGDLHSSAPTTSVVSTLVAFPATVDSLATVASPSAGVAPVSDSDQTLHPNLVPIAFDTGASIPRTSDFAFEIAKASCGLLRSAAAFVLDSTVDSVVPNSGLKVASTPVDPHTLITGEDAAVDLSFPDSDSVDTVEFASTLVCSSFCQFGTAALVFLSDVNFRCCFMSLTA